MPTTAEYLNDLVNKRNELATGLQNNGIEVEENETFSTLIPKAIDAIETGGGDDGFYDAFWDNYQDYGNKTVYGDTGSGGVFDNNSWNDVTFKPKYDIKPTSAYAMFRYSNITDFSKCSINIDFSNCTDLRNCFRGSNFVHLGIIDCRNSRQAMSMIFADATKLKKIDKLICANSWVISDTFKGCQALTDVTVEGTLLRNVSMVDSPLTAESAKTFINCLESYAETESEYAYTITFSTTTWGYLDSEGETASPNNNSWREYINDKGWNAS